ncbi:MAG: methyltransferase domain-containing protein [Chloroflexota bacterium]|nr:methyltransferase domain-containing protein [Chloroflexota bacterium]
MIYFDALAEDYDRREADNPVMQLMRARSLAVLQNTFPDGSTLLDVGCGTGTEACWLSKRGRTVFGVDSSPQMLEVLSRRAAAADLSVSTRLLRAGDLMTLADELGEGSFDGAYSSFGALNTEPALEPPVAALSRLVRPGGRIVLSVMNRWCLAEMALLAVGGRAAQALRRTRSSLRVAVGSTFAEVRYPSWHQLMSALHPSFRVLKVQALPLLLLPYAWPALAAHPWPVRMQFGLDLLRRAGRGL